MVLWTSDTGIDGENPVDLDELDLILIDPLPCHAWYQNMADFADGISDRAAGRSLSRTLNGKGAFRRFRNELHERHPELISCLAVPGRGQSAQVVNDEGDAFSYIARFHVSDPRTGKACC